jgi:hypothetical protein
VATKRPTKKRVQPRWQAAFLMALRASPGIALACRQAKVDRRTAYRARERDPAFAQAWDDALESGLDDLEQAVFQRARDASDTLAIFLLKCHRPERYSDKPKPVAMSIQVAYDESDSAGSTAEAASGSADGPG